MLRLGCTPPRRRRRDHLQITCETVRAFVRREYWSGKTVQPQREDLPPLVSFLGSQRFGHVIDSSVGHGAGGESRREGTPDEPKGRDGG